MTGLEGVFKTPKFVHLDTLELTVTNESETHVQSSQDLYSKRQRSKAIGKAINGKLLYLNSDRHKDYQAAYYCSEYLLQDGDKVTAKFCRKRSCPICARVNAAKLMAAYVNPLLDLPDLHLVTLTAPNVSKDELDSEVANFGEVWRKMYWHIRRKVDLKGFRKLEITYNSSRNDFNPHMHLLVQGREAAELTVTEWLKHNEKASKKAQSIERVHSKGALLEVFKYVTKPIIKDTFDSRSLDAMYRAIHGKRVYFAMGINKECPIEVESYERVKITHRSERIDVWKWCNDRNDWYTITGEAFNDTTIDNEAQKIITTINNSFTHEGTPQTTKDYEGPPIHDIIQRSRHRDKILF